jgi:hypothetical protein
VKRGVWIAVLGVAAFVAIILVQIPASWVIPERLARERCGLLDGSLWSGTCSGVVVNGRAIGDLSWSLKPLRLFIGQAAAHLRIDNGAVNAVTDVQVSSGGRIALRNLVADLPLDSQLLPQIPQNLRGRAHINAALLQIERGILTRLEGELQIHDLADLSGGHDTALGSFAITFPPDASGDPTGRIHDLDGPLAVDGTLKLTRAPGFEIAGFIAPRKGATTEVVNNIAFLGTPDASGRREFSLAGTF